MNLRRVRITNFRSINGPVDLLIDPRVTVLVGANDHGKTNVLAAIKALNADVTLTSADLNWDAPEGSDIELAWDFELTEDEYRDLQAKRLEAMAKMPADGMDSQLTRDPPRVWRARKSIQTAGLVISAEAAVLPDEQTWVSSRLPRVELFEAVEKTANDVTLAQLETPPFEFMKGIFIKAGLWDARGSIFAQNPRTSRMLDEASDRLTRTLQREWEQGKELSWKLQHTADRIQLLIKDPSVSNTYVLPSQRSAGFTAFFVLSLTLFARTWDKQDRSFIYLFDEPGTYLHPVAQVNLQRVFEVIADRRQLIYSTHSIFLVNKNEPPRNRVVRKGPKGTEVDKKPFARNWKAVRDSLGILFSNNFFIADRTVVVEGPSDPIYLLAALLYLIRRVGLDIDLNAFSIMDGGTSANYLAMTKIMLAEGRKVHCLLDGDKSGRDLEAAIRRVAATEISEGALVITVLPKDCSIEDIMPHRALLGSAAVLAVKDLVAAGLVAYRDEIGDQQLQAAIDNVCRGDANGKTLGRRLVDAIGAQLKGDREISKVNIACRYEDLLRGQADGAPEQPEALQSLIAEMHKHFELPSRRASEDVRAPE